MEYWELIHEFPEYAVSNYGQVRRARTGRILERSQVTGGALRVTLLSDGRRYSRSVKVLVAEAFVERPLLRFDTPVQMDNHELNVRADNLVWRTRSFAWRYKKQFEELSSVHSMGPLMDVETRYLYRDVYEASTMNGVLMRDVWRCIHGSIERIPPTNQRILLAKHAGAINR